MPTPTDDFGTPLSKGLYYERASDRDVHEMLGLVKGVVCDGLLNNDEVKGFRAWLQRHPDVTVSYPGRQLAERIVHIFDDGEIDPVERAELYEMFCDTVGTEDTSVDFGTRLPLDDPPPTVIFDGQTFVFTGGLAWGPRRLAEKAVQDRGGKVHDRPVSKPCTLVIGILGNRAWIHSTHGRKIEEAIHIRECGFPMQIISEEHWLHALYAAG